MMNDHHNNNNNNNNKLQSFIKIKSINKQTKLPISYNKDQTTIIA